METRFCTHFAENCTILASGNGKHLKMENEAQQIKEAYIAHNKRMDQYLLILWTCIALAGVILLVFHYLNFASLTEIISGLDTVPVFGFVRDLAEALVSNN